MPQTKQPQNQHPRPKPDLQFERKNHDMIKLPKYARISKRPIPHPPVSSPYAGPSVPKTIYISSSTPFMSAVKRVQKLLLQAEKRATASITANNGKKGQKGNNAHSLLAGIARGEGQDQLKGEAVFVKATGRAIQKAVKVGKWFEMGGREAEYRVRVKTGAVMVVDDVEEDEDAKQRALREADKARREVEGAEPVDETMLTVTTGDETTFLTVTTATSTGDDTSKGEDAPAEGNPTSSTDASSNQKPLSKSAMKKRKRAASLAASIADTELPESRTRWVNSVEVAVSLK